MSTLSSSYDIRCKDISKIDNCMELDNAAKLSTLKLQGKLTCEDIIQSQQCEHFNKQSTHVYVYVKALLQWCTQNTAQGVGSSGK